MSHDSHPISTLIAERFLDAIAKIQAEAGRVTADHQAALEAQITAEPRAYREEIAQLRAQLKQTLESHAQEIARLKADAEHNQLREKARTDELAGRLESEKAQIGPAITEHKQRISDEAEILIAKVTAEYERKLAQVKADTMATIAKITSEHEEEVAQVRARNEALEKYHAELIARTEADIGRAIAALETP